MTVSTSPPPPRLSDAGDRLLAQLARRGQAVVRVPHDLDWIAAIAGDRQNAFRAIERLGARGRLVHVRRGLWVARTPVGTLAVGALQLVGAVTPEQHLVTAGRALAEHGLSDQAFLAIIVAAPAARRGWEWQGESVRYVRLPSSRLWGGTPARAADAPTRIANPERAILDSLAHPDWGVSLAQAVEALDRFLTGPDEVERLALAARRYGNANLARRVGFLISRLRDDRAAQALLALRGASRATIALDSGASNDGPVDRRWRVRENIALDELLGHQRVG